MCCSPYLFYCRCVKMALVHDIAECIVGDITPHDGVSKTDKHFREQVSCYILYEFIVQNAVLKV